MRERIDRRRKTTTTRPLSTLLQPKRSPSVATADPPAPTSSRGRSFSFADIPLVATNLPVAGLKKETTKVSAPKPAKRHPDPRSPAHGSGASGKHKEQAKAETICEAPKAMYAVTSGAFLDGLSMEDYYPDLVGHGWWAHGSSAGTWETGSRCGGNVQLVGSINMLCRPEQYQLEQTVTHDKSIFNGSPDEDNGTTRDDIADSRRNYSKAPARQEHAGPVPEGILYRDDVTPPSELRISMADPPSVSYSQFRSIEWDRTFVTTLRGPAGSKSVTWRSSIRVADGKVTKNTLK